MALGAASCAVGHELPDWLNQRIEHDNGPAELVLVSASGVFGAIVASALVGGAGPALIGVGLGAGFSAGCAYFFSENEV